MYYYLVAPQVIVRSDEAAFTYHSTTPLAIGTLVRVGVGSRIVNGVVLENVKDKPKFATKPIEAIIAPHPLPKPLLQLAQWLSDYYVTHLATVLQTVLPAGLHRTRRISTISTRYPKRDRTKIVLNKDQQTVLSVMERASGGTVLLHGVTGSGKTQVYIEAAKHQSRSGRSSILLVPEIALTPQLVAEFANHFQNLVVTHSGMTESQRHQAWLQVLNSSSPMVVIGPRSALFMPLNNVGLIVVDECHEPSYKQEQAPRYSALRAASILAQQHSAKLILGSATPSVTDYYLAQSTKSPIPRLPQPAITTSPVIIEVIDLKNRDHFRHHRFFSKTLIERVEESMANGHQTLLFHNRRGTAPTTMCDHCGWVAECPTCFLPLTLHSDQHHLRCHICGYQTAVPPSCPVCHEPTIIFKGIGTKLIEEEARKLFPKARIARFDADTHPSEAIHNRYQDLYDGSVDILIGTQILAKGLDLPKLSTVGVIQADSGLVLPDYQAEERVFQLLYQVIGRVGRSETAGYVVIQTYQPDHPVIKAAINRDYQAFYRSELVKRQAGHSPPFRYLLKLMCSYRTEEGAVSASQKLTAKLRASHPKLEILGPTPAFHERLGGAYRWQLVVKAKTRSDLTELVRTIPSGWQTDLDPISLL